MSHPLTRALFATALAATLAVTLAGCGSTTQAISPANASTESAAASASPAESASGSASALAYPIEITTAFGTTVIPAAPERVAVIGYTEGDTVLALGTVPVSFYEFAFPGEVGGPWATELLDGQAPVVLKGELNVEQIASLQPDLIIGINQALTQQQYDQLTVIAPTLARPAEYTDYGVPPMVQAQMIGQALGKSGEIAALGADVQTAIDDAKAANPALEGKTVSVVWPTPDGSWFAYSSTDPRVELLESLGLVQSPAIAALGTDAFYHTISAENTAQIDADVIVVLDVNAQRATVEADPVFNALPAVKDGNVVWVTDPNVIGAFSYASVLSLPYALDALVPELTAVAGGAAPSPGAAATTSG